MGAFRRSSAVLFALSLIGLSCDTSLRLGAELQVPAPGSAEEFEAAVVAIRHTLDRLDTGLFPAEVAHLSRTIVEMAQESDLSPGLVLSVILVESSGYNYAVSHAGARGLMQLRPATGHAFAHRAGVRWRGADTLFDPAANVRLGVTYLRHLIDRYGSVSTALAAYNWGPTRISERLRRGETVPAEYVQRVQAIYGVPL